jgi:hypothetical protein
MNSLEYLSTLLADWAKLDLKCNFFVQRCTLSCAGHVLSVVYVQCGVELHGTMCTMASHGNYIIAHLQYVVVKVGSGAADGARWVS